MLLVESLLGSSSSAANYIEDVFSTYLYTGNSSTQTITNGIDLAGKGGLVWAKRRDGAANHVLTDTARGASNTLYSNLTNAQQNDSPNGVSFNSNGFSVGGLTSINTNTALNVSWTFRKQAKFFDIVTYTGTGANRTISHNLGSAPGCIIIKRTDATAAWPVYFGITSQHLILNTNAARVTGSTYWNTTAPTSSVFSLGTDFDVNANGGTYIAYLFASNAGGFGASGTDNVITCGIYNGTGATGNNVTLNYEPQFVMIKRTSTGGTSPDWKMFDTMRGMPIGSDSVLLANSSSAEGTGTFVAPTATGFQLETTDIDYNELNQQYFYIAIRRGPMKTPTVGTSVFSPIASSAATGTTLTTGFPVDAQIFSLRTGASNKNNTYDRLRGVSFTTTESGARLITSSAAAETTGNETRLWDNTSFQMPSTFGGASTVFWNFRRAPGFFDVVCYTGTGVNRTISHNLGAVPELMIVKRRSSGTVNWQVYSASLSNIQYMVLNTPAPAAIDAARWNSTRPTSSVFSLGTAVEVNASAATYVAYLFSTVAGVSKVGSYTGTGTTLQVNCGFTGGARFVLIKRTDNTGGDWYVWDSARGIIAGNDPYLLLNFSSAENTATDYIDTYSAGFEISSTAPAAINANGGTFIFLAIA